MPKPFYHDIMIIELKKWSCRYKSMQNMGGRVTAFFVPRRLEILQICKKVAPKDDLVVAQLCYEST
ncbi:hypothetical protein DBP97_06295 [Lactobacillus helveticus]|nr:hypothetical protein DBP97_06295 [Lactobacillus helveticus]